MLAISNISNASVLSCVSVRGMNKVIKLKRSYDGCCGEKGHIKIVLYARSSVLPLFHVGHVAQNRRSVRSLAWHE